MQPNFSIKSGNKVLGVVQGDTLRKVIQGSKHFLRKPLSIAIDLAALDMSESSGVKRVEVLDTEPGVIFVADVEHIRQAGVIIDRGWGVQLALPLSGWIRRTHGSSLPVQMSLFGEVSR